MAAAMMHYQTRGGKRVRRGLILAWLLVLVAIPAPALAHGRGHPNWSQYDRAAYVVSTLNLPLCDVRTLVSERGHHLDVRTAEIRQPLSTVLRTQEGARLYDVLQSTVRHWLYFVEVRGSPDTLLEVYAYVMGWTLPRGVRDAICVRPAPAVAVAAYQPDKLIRLARFTTTFP